MPKVFKCDLCNKKFNDNHKLVSHMHVHSTDTPYACPLCSYRGKTKKYLARHTRQMHKERTGKNKCDVCGKLFLNPSNLRVHAMVHSGEKPHRCEVCGKTFRVTYSLNTHMLIHTNEKPFHCSFCDYACRDSSALRKHTFRHMGMEKIYECTICDKGCKSRMALKIHISETHLDIDMKKFPCSDCDKLFKSNAQRNVHINAIHKRALICNCPICGRRLLNKHNLAAHMRTHLDDRPFRCVHPGCKLAFKDKNSLKKHSVLHDPKLHHPCEYCGRKFARKAHVKRHERIMHLERTRNVECHYCGSKFYSKNYLVKHIQTKHVYKHEFKYICDICGLVTHNKPSIVMHIKYGHSNDNDLECKICDTNTVYKRHAYLKSHYRTAHNVKYKITRKSSRVYKEERDKPAVEIKVEPIEADSYEDIQLLEMDKVEDNANDESLDYSKRVLSEDIAESVLRNREPSKEVDFDEFFIRNVFTKQEKEENNECYDIDEEQNENVKKRIKKILMKTQKIEREKALREKRKKEEIEKRKREKEETELRVEKEKEELIELRRVRDMYNARMKDALAKEKVKLGQLREQVKIKYFKKKDEDNKTTEANDKTSHANPIEIDVAESLVDDTLGNESDDEHIVNKLTDDDGEDPGKNVSSDEVLNENVLNEKSDSNNIDDRPSCNSETNIIEDNSENDNIEHDYHISNDINKDHSHLINDNVEDDTDNRNNDPEDNLVNDSSDKTENNDKNQEIRECETSIDDHSVHHNSEQDNHTTNTNSDILDHRTSNVNIEDLNVILEHNTNNDNINNDNMHQDVLQKVVNNDIVNIKTADNFNTITNDEDSDQPLLKRRVRPARKTINKRCQNDKDVKNDKYEEKDKEENSDSDEGVIGKARKIDFKTFQCYICFKLYPTKQALVDHCQEHFDICNERTLTKCPMCNHVSYKGITNHMKKKHDVTVKIPFTKIKDRKNENGSKYCYDVNGTSIEVIPSVVILNKIASNQLDKIRRDVKDKSIAKSKLVKKGNDWIVEKEAIDIEYDEIPELSDKELYECKITDNDIDRLGQLNYIVKRKGLKMMFPCFKCDKICQSFSALKLHKRRHEDNPKPFKPRVSKKNKKVEDKKIKLNKSNRTAMPKPITRKHKCDAELKEFFESNIRGKDIEFWQFLKIFNKMDRENVNDFEDLEKRIDFGNHLDYYKDVKEGGDDTLDNKTQ